MQKSSLSILKTNLFSVLLAVLFLAISSCSYNNLNSGESVKSLDNEVVNTSLASPVATIEAPSFFEGGVPKNRNLIISFTKPIDTETFWDCLIITDSMGKNLKENFNTPIWSNNDTLVEISPNVENFVDLKNKATFDIYVTIPKSVEDQDGNQLFNPIDFRYRINDSLDEEKPDLYVSRAELPGDYLSSDSEGYLTVLIDGEITPQNMKDIYSTNHINSKFDIYLEGNDYGGGDVWASIKFQRVYDAKGNELDEPEQSKLVKLTNITYAENYYDTICLDLSDSKYLDGMYKITACIKDASCNESQNQHIVYVIRDTSFLYSPNAAITVELPKFDLSEEDPLIPTKEKIKEYTDYIQFNNVSDDVFFSQEIDNEIIEYQQPKTDFSYYLSWGFSLTELSIPVRIYGEFKEEEQGPAKETDENDEEIDNRKFLFALPDEFKLFRENNLNKDIILQATVIDSVGNSCLINSVVPPQIDFFNYEVWDGSEEDTRKIKLNFSDLTNSISKAGGIPDKLHSVSYRIYYGCLDNVVDVDTLELTRNFFDEISDVSDTEDFTNISEGTLSDNTEFEIEENSTYIAYIQPVYSAFSRTNGRWCGDTFGPLYELTVDTISSGEDPEQYSFSLEKESNGTNSGAYTISVSIQNGQDDVNYYPCYSLDGKNWNTYKDLSFVVNNPLRAPIKSGELWSDLNLWQNNSFFAARDELLASYSEVTAKVRIMAVKGNKTVCSDIQEITFTREDDNIPPEASAKITSHDSMLSFDGRSFKYDGIIREDDFNTNEVFKYYYTEYNENWGSNLSVLSEDKINELPVFQSRLSANVWKTSYDSALQYSISPVVYVNGLKDGKYMFFAKVWDSFGNENLITLGKANIRTFKNKLKVTYDKENNQFTTTLNLEDNETRFDRNMINIQAYSTDKKSSYANGWYDYYENQNELQNCSLDTRGKILSNVTKNSVSIIDKVLGSKVSKAKPLQTGTFYRISVQSFNDNTYNPKTKRGVNKKAGRPYEDSVETGPVVPSLENETDYDLYTDETVSYPVYYYIPAADEDMSKFKSSFFKNTAAVSSNRPVIINLISSVNNLGPDIDEWERRGKLIKTYYFTGSNGGIPFKDNDVREDMLNSDETGQFFYVMVVHFANNTSEISNVYKMMK